MQLIPARIGEAMRRVHASIWRSLPGEPLTVTQTDSYRTHCRIDEVSAASFKLVPSDTFYWGPKFSQRWFRVALPSAKTPESRYLVWEDQAEATVYIDGCPYYGLDLAHRHCPLPANVSEITIEAVCIKTGIWLDGSAEPLAEKGSLYKSPYLVTRDDLAWSTYHDLLVLYSVLEAEYKHYYPEAKKSFIDPIRYSPPILRISPLFRRWCERLDRAIDVLDREGLAAFAKSLKGIYVDFQAEKGSLRAILTGHAHIDLVWLWTEQVGEFKAVHSWATQARLMSAYPEFKFGYSQPASYEAVARRSPRLYGQVRDLIRAGRWEATGASYVEFDTQLPCGEGLLRSLRLGQAAFAAIRGSQAKVCWLPDVFGYSGVLPQLLRGFGVEGFFTTKLSWNTVNRAPQTSFRWRGTDGSEVVAHIVQLHDYNEAVDIGRLREDALHHQQAAVHSEFLVPTGYGDGGGGVTEEMCERARRVANLSGVPRTNWGSIETFFAKLAEVKSDLPEIGGELLLELHRGVLTTHGALKAAFRGLERALQRLEAVHVVCGLGLIDQNYWKRLAFAQFHDYIPGSSIWEVYAEGIPELSRLAADADREASTALTGAGVGGTGWFNPFPARRLWVDGGKCFEMPPLSGGPLSSLQSRLVGAPEVSISNLKNSRVHAVFDAKGGISNLTIDGQSITLGGGGHRLCAYPDHPAKFEAWDVDRNSLVSGFDAQLVGEPIASTSAMESCVSFTYKIARQSRIVVRYILVAEEAVLRIVYEVDWSDPEMLLKAIFTTKYQGRDARFGAPYGSTLRGQWPGRTIEEAQWEVPASRWMVVMDDAQSEGLAIITECKYGFTVRDGQVGVSLLRSALVTGAEEHPQIRERPDRPSHSDLGCQRIQVALARFTSDLPAEYQPALLADLLYTPCLPYSGVEVNAGLKEIIGAPTLVPSWAEPASDRPRWTLRLHETQGRRGVAVIKLHPGWKAARVGMDGVLLPNGGVVVEWSFTELSVEYTPYQVVSITITRD
ncbi:MAG: glycoside hydrolase family 38 C-terminal domain-containing protein [Nibricoccus sp.]